MQRFRKLALFMGMVGIMAGIYVIAGLGIANGALSCPSVTSDTTFSTTSLETECTSGVTLCTTKSGVTYDSGASVLKIPPLGGNFQAPAGAAITKNVYFAAAGDFDKDGWEDFAAADDSDKIYMMRNQTITCDEAASGTAITNPAYYPCSGPTPAAQTIASTWWDTVTNVRNSSFQSPNGYATAESACNDTVDDDGDGRVNDGCPVFSVGAGAETGAQCAMGNVADEDGDGKVNDGCPTFGAAETFCTSATDNDTDGYMNDGCPAYEKGAGAESSCNDTTDDDGDGRVNDGCATYGGGSTPLKANGGYGATLTPMVGADFDGDGWTDFAAISHNCSENSGACRTSGFPINATIWPMAARLYLNTKNCHKTSDSAGTWTPCGVGMLCSGQTTNGDCNAAAGLTNGTALSETVLSCVNSTGSADCPYNFATFATYDLKTGAAVTANTSSSPSAASPTTTTPGDFGPLSHPSTNIVAVDWDGDGDIDLLYGHASGTCLGSLCSTAGQVFHTGIDVWLNDCDSFFASGTTNCAGHIPHFTHSTTNESMTSGTQTSAQAAPGVLIPSTSHNNSSLLPNAYLGFDVANHRTPAFAYEDIDNDGKRDLVLGAPGCCSGSGNEQNRLRIFKGTGTGTNTTCASPPCSFNHILDTANPLSLSTSDGTYPGFEGAMTGMFVQDFSLDGYPDLITASDGYSYGNTLGGRTRYWKNTGNASAPFGTNWPACSATPASCAGCSASCNPSPTTIISQNCGDNGTCTDLAAVPPEFPDFDQTFMIDYDHDPQHTMDPVITNGNTANEFYIFPNRASSSSYAACGSVSSGTLAAPIDEATISGACITPTANVPSGTGINWFLSNDGGASWQLACLQLTGNSFTPPLTNSQCCVTFSDITGRDIQWKAELDANVADKDTTPCTNPAAAVACGVGAPNGCNVTGSATPTIASVASNYTYTTAQQHYKAGVIVSDGVTYTGSFTQPGDRGHLYAISADFGTQYYDVAAKLDAQGSRYVYTSSTTGTGPSPVDVSVSNAADTTLQAAIGATTTPDTTSALTWFLGPRFGIYNSGTAETTLGAVVGSTPAILQKPFRPGFYTFLSSSDRSLYDTFATTQATSRIPLVVFGAMDGVVHAVYAIATTIGDARNGEEAWGYVPPYVAATIKADYDASCPAGACSSLTRTITAYPDGSPTLADFKKSDGTIATAAVISDGNGGSEITALDVTQTVTPTSSTANTVQGPTPFWSAKPGDSGAGFATSKPAIARVKIGGVEKFIVIAGTGVNNTDNTKGKIVSGYNLQTGALLWKFELACALTSDITIFETDDSGEQNNPTIDGYVDRAVFADFCGNVYKINPAQDLSAATPQYWMGNDNGSYGAANSLGTSNGVTRRILFKTSSALASGGDTGERPITNTIGARTDSSSDMVLFFGTGGVETFDASKQNAFFAIYAKDGSLRSGAAGRVDGTCASGKCDKFYGGVVVSTDTVYVLRSKDADIGSGSCDLGSSVLDAYGLSTLTSTFSISDIGGSAIAASAGPLYGDAGALYFATVSGHIERVGTPRASTAGADSGGGTLNNLGSPEVAPGNAPFTLIGWRVVL